MQVCIAEKPSVGREIAQVLGAKSKKDGYYEGNGYQVTWTFGHFCTLYTPDDYKPHWKKWSLDSLPMLPPKFETKLIGNAGVKKQFGIIKKLLSKATGVINCGDAGQEGELIQRWVLKQAKYNGPTQRLWISSLTKEAIVEGFKNLKPESDYNNLYFAGSSRAIGDWLLGMNATRLFTLKFGGYKQVLSVGRVQTPTLAMVVQRHLEIENFKSENFWELQTVYKDTTFNCEKGKFTKIEDGQSLLNQIQDKPFTITDVSKKEGKEYAPRLFDLTSLQVYCNKKWGYTAESTLKHVQKLYELKVVTYPRVDTTYLPEDVFPKIKGILSKLSNYSQQIAPVLNSTIKKTKRVFDDKKITDHHAIIPTGQQTSLDPTLQNVYDIITRHFIAAFYPDCKVANTVVKGKIEEVPFKATGKQILDPGWQVLFPKSKSSKNKKDEEKILPHFDENETGEHTPTLTEKKTSPPKYYTEATLLRAMESAGKKVEDETMRDLMKANGIGRPSTRANIIETLFRRKYIRRQRKLILATDVGISLIQTIDNDLLTSVELTGQWEKQLRDIEQGEYKAQTFIADMKKMIDQLVYDVRRSQKKITYVSPTAPKKSKSKAAGIKGLKCPKCTQGQLLQGKTAYGCSQYKEGCTFKVPFSFGEKKVSDNQIARLISKGSTVTLKGFKLNGQKVNGKMVMDAHFNVSFQAEGGKVVKPAQSSMPKCPRCNKGTIIKGKTAYGCDQWKGGCKWTFTFDDIKAKANGRPMTKDLVMQIFKEAK